MYIARLTVSLMNHSIRRNKPSDLMAQKHRGDVLDDGAVVRGEGTSFVSVAAKEAYDRLIREQNVIREAFNRRFMRAPFDGYYLIDKVNEAKEFITTFKVDPQNKVVVTEFSINSLGVEGFDEDAMAAWGTRVKNQLKKIPLGVGKENGKPKLDSSGIAALKALANCPAMSAETREKILLLANMAESQQIDRLDLHREIEMLDVKMDSQSASPMDIERTV